MMLLKICVIKWVVAVSVEMAASLPTNAKEFVKHPGVTCTKSGRWGAKIRNPINKIYVWLGTYSTPEEAAGAYTRKKLEYESVAAREMDASLPANEATSKKHPAARFRLRKVHGAGSVYQYKAGKWRAEIQVKNVRHRLGVYATAEDAEEALSRKRQELGLTVHTEQSGVFQSRTNHTYQKKSGLRETEVPSPKVKVKCRLGTRATAEDADETSNRKRNNEMSDASRQRPRHAYLRKSGRWQSEIKNPITKVRLYLGTYDTAEKAEEAYNKKKREFDLMVHAHKKHKQSSVGCKVKDRQLKSAVIVVEGNSDLTSRSDKPCMSADGILAIKTVKEKEFCGDMIKENVENTPMPCIESMRECNLGILNSYGQLVGEYSRLDDELWLCNPGDYGATIGCDEGLEGYVP